MPLVISFTDGMDFTGRTVDPEGRPAAQANFYGIVTAEMEDAKLHGEEKMIAYTDKVVPLAQLGEMSKAQSKPKANEQGRGRMTMLKSRLIRRSRSSSPTTRLSRSAARSIPSRRRCCSSSELKPMRPCL